MRLDDPAVRQQLSGVLEEEDTVAEQGPALCRLVSCGTSGFTIRSICWRTWWLVLAHGVPHRQGGLGRGAVTPAP